VKKLLLMSVLVAGAAEAAPISFSQQVVPVLRTRCATCHLTGTEAGKISLVPAKARANLVNVKSSDAPKLTRVVPGKPGQSYLMKKLEGTHIAAGGKGARMPFGTPPLPPAQVDLIRRWIAEGAKAN
jgi:hypothetical protein